jgi:hypothetical protein
MARINRPRERGPAIWRICFLGYSNTGEDDERCASSSTATLWSVLLVLVNERPDYHAFITGNTSRPLSKMRFLNSATRTADRSQSSEPHIETEQITSPFRIMHVWWLPLIGCSNCEFVTITAVARSPEFICARQRPVSARAGE